MKQPARNMGRQIPARSKPKWLETRLCNPHDRQCWCSNFVSSNIIQAGPPPQRAACPPLGFCSDFLLQCEAMFGLRLPSAPKESTLSFALLFLFRLAWIGRIPVPLLIASLEIMLNLRVRLNIDVEFD